MLDELKQQCIEADKNAKLKCLQLSAKRMHEIKKELEQLKESTHIALNGNYANLLLKYNIFSYENEYGSIDNYINLLKDDPSFGQS